MHPASPASSPGASASARSGPRVVALGGGHGLFASLSALRHVTDRLTAVVTVADNGGSSGRLREEFDVLPPGDLRMALAALCGDDDWGRTWAELMQHRFAGTGQLRDHVVGNLLIVGLWERFGEPVEALEWVGRLLGAHGRVLPMSTTPLTLTARVRGAVQGARDEVTEVTGQVEVATTPGEILSVSLDPADPPACEQALTALDEAEWVVWGPGSWYSSVLPHLLVPRLREALCRQGVRIVLVLNLSADTSETAGLRLHEHLDVLRSHAPGLSLHTVIADSRSVPDPENLRAAVARLGGRLHLADVAVGDGTPRHDPVKLADAYRHVFAGPNRA